MSGGVVKATITIEATLSGFIDNIGFWFGFFATLLLTSAFTLPGLILCKNNTINGYNIIHNVVDVENKKIRISIIFSDMFLRYNSKFYLYSMYFLVKYNYIIFLSNVLRLTVTLIFDPVKMSSWRSPSVKYVSAVLVELYTFCPGNGSIVCPATLGIFNTKINFILFTFYY